MIDTQDLRDRLNARTYPEAPRIPDAQDVTGLSPDARAAYMQELNDYDQRSAQFKADVAAYNAVEMDVTRELYARLRGVFNSLTPIQHQELCEYAYRERHSESDWLEQIAALYSEIAGIFA